MPTDARHVPAQPGWLDGPTASLLDVPRNAREVVVALAALRLIKIEANGATMPAGAAAWIHHAVVVVAESRRPFGDASDAKGQAIAVTGEILLDLKPTDEGDVLALFAPGRHLEGTDPREALGRLLPWFCEVLLTALANGGADEFNDDDGPALKRAEDQYASQARIYGGRDLLD